LHQLAAAVFFHPADDDRTVEEPRLIGNRKNTLAGTGARFARAEYYPWNPCQQHGTDAHHARLDGRVQHRVLDRPRAHRTHCAAASFHLGRPTGRLAMMWRNTIGSARASETASGRKASERTRTFALFIESPFAAHATDRRLSSGQRPVINCKRIVKGAEPSTPTAIFSMDSLLRSRSRAALRPKPV